MYTHVRHVSPSLAQRCNRLAWMGPPAVLKRPCTMFLTDVPCVACIVPRRQLQGFGTGLPFGRDDLSSTLEVARYRHALQMEEKAAEKAAAQHSNKGPTGEAEAEAATNTATTTAHQHRRSSSSGSIGGGSSSTSRKKPLVLSTPSGTLVLQSLPEADITLAHGPTMGGGSSGGGGHGRLLSDVMPAADVGLAASRTGRQWEAVGEGRAAAAC